MALKFHPERGFLLICDYSMTPVVLPEMVKRRPVVVVSPKFKARQKLCTVVPLSTTPPARAMPYHCEIRLPLRLPKPFFSETAWVKADMIATVSFERLEMIRLGKDRHGKHLYATHALGTEEMQRIDQCILEALGLAR